MAGNRDEEDRIDIGATLRAHHFQPQSGLSGPQYTTYQDHDYDYYHNHNHKHHHHHQQNLDLDQDQNTLYQQQEQQQQRRRQWQQQQEQQAPQHHHHHHHHNYNHHHPHHPTPFLIPSDSYPTATALDHQHHHQHQQQERNHPQYYRQQHRSLSPTHFSHADSNFQAFNANATSILPVDVDVVEPDDFYRNYRGTDTSDTAPLGHTELMASSAIPTPRHTHNASLRSNGNGTTPRHPTISSSARTGLRSSARSASVPTTDDSKISAPGSKSKPVASGTGQKPSVKDLKKRFDQHATQPTSSSAGVRKTIPRISNSSSATTKGAGCPSSPTDAHTSYTSLRSSVTRASDVGPTTGRSTQRNRAVTEDQVSNNSQSFASRIAKPRTSVGGHTPASKSMSNLSQPSSPASIPPAPPSRGLLFGEVLPTDSRPGAAGYGIEGARPRRTSESNLQKPALHQRSLSHADAEPSSPSDWYRPPTDNSREPLGHAGGSNVSSRPTRGRNRSHSDLGGKRPDPQSITSIPRPNPIPTSETTPSSRLPIAVRKLNSPVDSLSPPSTRSNSPSTRHRKRNSTQEKLARTTNPTRAKTPTSIPATKRTNRSGAITPNGNTRLNAYISAPPPKLSPTLRSSRPRQPVSSATTTSSRMKAVDREKGADSRSGNRTGDSSGRRRKISMGPIDFESRREQIKLSYTKSIRETEARAATKRAEEERKKKAEAEARAKAARAAEQERKEQERREKERLEQEAKEMERLKQERLAQDCLGNEQQERESEEAPAQVDPQALEVAGTPTAEPPVLTITTSAGQSNLENVRPESSKARHDSLTLGIPGGFPTVAVFDEEEEVPPSAVSNTTEFDIEPQTEPPMPGVSQRDGVEPTSRANKDPRPILSGSEYRSPFDEESSDDDVIPIKISLDTPPKPDAQHALHTQADDRPGVETIGLCYQEPDEEYEPKPLESPPGQTTVTIIGRNSDFQPQDQDRNEPALSTDLPKEEQTGEGDLRSEHSENNLKLSYNADAFLRDDPSPGFAGREEYFVSPSVQASVARMRDSAGDQSEPGEENASTEHDSPRDGYFTSHARTATDVSQTLTIPRTTDVKNRISQTTTWTDYSIDSQNAFSLYGAHDSSIQNRDSSFRESISVSELDSRSQSIQCDHDSREYPSSPEMSPHGTYQDPEASFDHDHQLPEIDTGDSFAVDYFPRKNSTAVSSIPILPDHAPPPPPDVVSFPDAASSEPPSEYFDDTRPSSYVRTSKDGRSVFSMDQSMRESEDFTRSESAPQSIEQGLPDRFEPYSAHPSLPGSRQSLAEGADKTHDDQGLSPQERKRLFTRLETIKELIDTEAFFIRDMNIVEEIYKGTAEACPKLDDTTIKLIFRNTDQIISFHSGFLSELKEGVSNVYTPKVHRNMPKEASTPPGGSTPQSTSPKMAPGYLSDENDRQTSLGPIFLRNMEKMKVVHETFLKNSDHAAKRLIQIQEDPTVNVWLNECNEVARDLTKAWNLDSLLIKPMQRITKYPNLIVQLLHETPSDHPDRPLLESAKSALETAIVDINKTKKNFELVGQIVGRKRKDSDVKAGFARAFGKRVDKLQAASSRPAEDPEYLKLHEKFGDDYLRLQVVLRDVEFYTRQVTDYVHEFLQFLSSMELVMRLQPSPHPEIESKWVRFNVSMRDVEKVALEQHLAQVRKQVIEPFEMVIKSYSNPSLAMKKRSKRRVDYDKAVQLQKNGKKVDKQLTELVEQYEALNEALKKELPKLSALTEKVGNICLGNFVKIQAQWYAIWKEKVKAVLEDSEVLDLPDIVSTFQRDFKFQEEQMNTIGIINPASWGRPSHSASTSESLDRLRPKPAELLAVSNNNRGRGLSLNSDVAPTLPTPDFGRRHSGQLTLSPSATSFPSPHQFYFRDQPSSNNGQSHPGSGSPMASEFSLGTRSLAAPSVRPSTGQSYESSPAVPTLARQSLDSGAHARRSSNSTHPSPYQTPENQRFSGLFQSALPLSDTPERQPRPSMASSRASSRDRTASGGYNVLWLAASLFEFNIETTKHEAGYPYLTYQAGEIFDVIAEKGELWLAKNQDDPKNVVGWLWSKHFAKLADD